MTARISYHGSAEPPSVVRKCGIETDFLENLRDFKYTLRHDIRDRATLEANFRQKFEPLSRVPHDDGTDRFLQKRALDRLIGLYRALIQSEQSSSWGALVKSTPSRPSWAVL